MYNADFKLFRPNILSKYRGLQFIKMKQFGKDRLVLHNVFNYICKFYLFAP